MEYSIKHSGFPYGTVIGEVFFINEKYFAHQSRLIVKVDTLYDKYYTFKKKRKKKKGELIIHEIH